MPVARASPNRKVLIWAREFMGYQPVEIARKLGVKPAKVEAWERGAVAPTLRQLEQLSDLYKQPLVSFFQDKPPEHRHWPPDYRAPSNGQARPLSPKTRTAIWEAQWRQSVAADLRQELGVKTAAILQSLTTPPSPEEAAELVHASIALDPTTQVEWAKRPELLFRNWRRVLESLGILVFRFDLPTEDARAFSLPDREAPVIAVSSNDYPNAAIFSLFHELAHLLYREPSTCNDLEFRQAPRSHNERVEARCNHFAGSFLVPKTALLSHPLVQSHKQGEWTQGQLADVAQFFGCSREVVLRRLVILNRAGSAFYHHWRRREEEYWRGAELPSASHPVKLGYARKRIMQQGEAYVRVVLEAYASRLINLSEASEYLGVKTKHVSQLQFAIAQGGDG